MKKILLSIILICFTNNLFEASACTTAIISSKFTKNGRPLLWKNRDSDILESKIMIFNDGKYNYVGLVNANDKDGKEIWIGYNSAGFAIMNSASYNLKDDTNKIADLEGEVIKKALQNCANIDDFENLLKNYPKPIGVEANFGVIDAFNGAAYFETNNFKFTKIDVNDTRIAPMGYVIRTNYSFTGRPDEGYGYIRFMQTERMLQLGSGMNTLTAKYLLQDVTKCLQHGLTNIDIRTFATYHTDVNQFVPFEDFIPRYNTSSSCVIEGIKANEAAELTVMYANIGWPCVSVAVPIWLFTNSVPEPLLAKDNYSSAWCKQVMEWKNMVFPITRGSGKKYININALYNLKGTGIMQQILPVENKIMAETEKKLNTWRTQKMVNAKDAQDLYLWIAKELANFKLSPF